MKIFVDCAADTRLARRVRRDIVERGRDVLQVPVQGIVLSAISFMTGREG